MLTSRYTVHSSECGDGTSFEVPSYFSRDILRIGRSLQSLRLAGTAVSQVNMPPGRAASERAKERGLIIVFGQYAHMACCVRSIASNQAATLIFFPRLLL